MLIINSETKIVGNITATGNIQIGNNTTGNLSVGCPASFNYFGATLGVIEDALTVNNGNTRLNGDLTLLSGDVTKYKKIKENANKELKVGMKIKCRKDIGIVIDIKDNYILYRLDNKDNKVKGCKFNEYIITDDKYKKYQKHIDKLRKKIKVGSRIQVLKHKGIVTKIVDNKI